MVGSSLNFLFYSREPLCRNFYSRIFETTKSDNFLKSRIVQEFENALDIDSEQCNIVIRRNDLFCMVCFSETYIRDLKVIRKKKLQK